MAHKHEPDTDPGTGLDRIFRSLDGFLDLLSDLAQHVEEGGEIRCSGELGDEENGISAVYTFSIRGAYPWGTRGP